MVDYRASRPMEDFFLNPTFDPNHNNFYHAMSVDYPSTTYLPQDEYYLQSTKLAPLESTLMADVHRKTMVWTTGYTSDEEVASPTDDDSSMRSASSVSLGSVLSLHDEAVDSCDHIEQRCNQAQAVRIQPAGKARIVDLPKLDLSYRRRSVRPASMMSLRLSRPASPVQRLSEEIHSSRSSQDSRADSSNLSSPHSPASTAPSSISEEQSASEPQKPNLQVQCNTNSPRHIDLLEAVRSPISIPNSPAFPRTVNQVKRQSTSMSDWSSIYSSSSISPAIRKMNKFSSKFDLKGFGKKSSPAQADDLESVKEPEPLHATQQAPQLYPPTRRSSLGQSKLVARGANERAAPITLPAFPEASESNMSARNAPSRQDSTRTLMKRRAHYRGSISGATTPVV